MPQFLTPSEAFLQSDWTPDATRVYFGCSMHNVRVAPCLTLALWHKGHALLRQRQVICDHSYAPKCFLNEPVFFSGNRLAAQGIIGAANQVDPKQYTQGVQVQPDGSFFADATALYSAPPGLTLDKSLIWKATRSVKCDFPNKTIVVMDNLLCDPSLTPHVCWNTPNEPVLNADGTSASLTTGSASAVLTASSSKPFGIQKIGGTTPDGVIHWIDGLDGNPMGPVGEPRKVSELPTLLDGGFQKMTVADQVRAGGYFRLHAVLPAGGGMLRTTIQVN